MNEQGRQRLRTEMHVAALMGPDDPLRRDLEGRIAAEGDWAEHEWTALLDEDRRLRLELQRVDLPPRLTERLMAIPDQVAPARPAQAPPKGLLERSDATQ